MSALELRLRLRLQLYGKLCCMACPVFAFVSFLPLFMPESFFLHELWFLYPILAIFCFLVTEALLFLYIRTQDRLDQIENQQQGNGGGRRLEEKL